MKKVGVVGAGASGLAAIKSCVEEGKTLYLTVSNGTLAFCNRR